MKERAFVGRDRRIWLVRARPGVRQQEVATHVTLELITDDELRIVSCRRDEWDVPAPDFPALLARSVASGASHQITPDQPSATS